MRWWDGGAWTDHFRSSQTDDEPASNDSVEDSSATAVAHPKGWSARKAAKRVAEAERYFVTGEQPIYIGDGGSLSSPCLVITNLRLFNYGPSGIVTEARSSALGSVAESTGLMYAITVQRADDDPIKLLGALKADFPSITRAVELARRAEPSVESLDALENPPAAHQKLTAEQISALEDEGGRLFPAAWNSGKRSKYLAQAVAYLLPEERIIFVGGGGPGVTPYLALTDVRLFSYGSAGVGATALLSDVDGFVFKAAGGIQIRGTSGEMLKLGTMMPKDFTVLQLAFERTSGLTAPAAALTRYEEIRAAAAEADRISKLTITERWPDIAYVGVPTTAVYKAMQQLCRADEEPWLVISPGGVSGALVAFDDRLVIVKKGVFTAWMAGSMGFGRVTTFYYSDITNIEYNAGLLNGVLEVLTPSYQGTANKDYWRGTTKSRNANSNDPFTLSNTLPMDRVTYSTAQPAIHQLHQRVSAAKRGQVLTRRKSTRVDSGPEADPPGGAPATTDASPPSLADELVKLGALRDAGHLTDQEFAVAKARLLGA